MYSNPGIPRIHCKNSHYRGISLKDYIEERAVEIADYIIATNATVRQAAKKFGVSKSTVHKDCVERLREINPSLASEVRRVLDVNKSERHIRGWAKISFCLPLAEAMHTVWKKKTVIWIFAGLR